MMPDHSEVFNIIRSALHQAGYDINLTSVNLIPTLRYFPMSEGVQKNKLSLSLEVDTSSRKEALKHLPDNVEQLCFGCGIVFGGKLLLEHYKSWEEGVCDICKLDAGTTWKGNWKW